MSAALPMPVKARVYITLVITGGECCLTAALARWHCDDSVRYFIYAAIALLASTLNVRLPAVTGTMSVNYVFILLAMMDLGFSETIVLACLSIAVQTGWRALRRDQPIHLFFRW